jgi:hypothetical protein
MGVGVGAGEGELPRLDDDDEDSPFFTKNRSKPDLRFVVYNVGSFGFFGDGPKGVLTDAGVAVVEEERSGVDGGELDRARLSVSDGSAVGSERGLEPKNDSIPR